MPYSKEEIKRRDSLFADGYAICGHCKQILPIDMFFKSNNKRYGLSSRCKECDKEFQRKYSAKNKDYINERSRNYRNSNKEKFQEKKQEREHKLKNRYSKYIQGAKCRNIPFELTLEDFDKITSMPCFYCGILPKDKFGNEFVGVDRIDSSKGYFLENVIPCCKECNQMKSKYALNEWISQIYKITNHLKTNIMIETGEGF